MYNATDDLIGSVFEAVGSGLTSLVDVFRRDKPAKKQGVKQKQSTNQRQGEQSNTAPVKNSKHVVINFSNLRTLFNSNASTEPLNDERATVQPPSQNGSRPSMRRVVSLSDGNIEMTLQVKPIGGIEFNVKKDDQSVAYEFDSPWEFIGFCLQNINRWEEFIGESLDKNLSYRNIVDNQLNFKDTVKQNDEMSDQQSQMALQHPGEKEGISSSNKLDRSGPSYPPVPSPQPTVNDDEMEEERYYSNSNNPT